MTASERRELEELRAEVEALRIEVATLRAMQGPMPILPYVPAPVPTPPWWPLPTVISYLEPSMASSEPFAGLPYNRQNRTVYALPTTRRTA